MSTAVVMAVAEWVVTGEATWVADGGTSERVAVRAVAKLEARIVLVEGTGEDGGDGGAWC